MLVRTITVSLLGTIVFFLLVFTPPILFLLFAEVFFIMALYEFYNRKTFRASLVLRDTH